MSLRPTKTEQLPPLLSVMLLMASFVVVVFGMRAAAEVITPILMAFILAILFAPVQQWLMDRGVPSWLALLLVLTIVLLVVTALIVVTLVSVSSVIDRLPAYQAGLQRLVDRLLVLTADLPFELDEVLRDEVLNVSRFLRVAGDLLRGLVDTFSNWFVIILLVAFMLADFAVLPQKLEVMFEDRRRIEVVADLMASIRRYLSITTTTGLLTGVGNAVLLIVMGVDFPILWGLMSFVLSYIPRVGFLISIVPPALVALLEFGWQQTLIVVVGFTLINTVVENIVKPRVMGERLNISPLFILISLVLWGFVLGPIGTILAVPLTLIATELFLETSKESHWLAVLMMANPEVRPRARRRRRQVRSHSELEDSTQPPSAPSDEPGERE